MPAKPKTTSWIWRFENGTQAVSLDLERKKLVWYDNPDCGCDDNGFDQSIDNFVQKGPRYGEPPDDVLQEIYDAVNTIVGN